MNHENLQSIEGNKLSNLYDTNGVDGANNSGAGGSSGASSLVQSAINWVGDIVHDIRVLREEIATSTWSELFIRCRNSRQLVLLVVFIALFFDNMLLTTVGKNQPLFHMLLKRKFSFFYSENFAN